MMVVGGNKPGKGLLTKAGVGAEGGRGWGGDEVR